MISNIGIPGLILILVIVLIIFGPSKLPEIGKAFGKTLTEFKNASHDLMTGDNHHEEDEKSKNEPELAKKKTDRSAG